MNLKIKALSKTLEFLASSGLPDKCIPLGIQKEIKTLILYLNLVFEKEPRIESIHPFCFYALFESTKKQNIF